VTFERKGRERQKVSVYPVQAPVETSPVAEAVATPS
jgi:hypothetical protein